MGKAFALLLMVLAIWIGVSVYTEGSSRALGGLFVKLGFVDEESPEADPVTDRVRGRVESLRRERAEREKRALGER